MRESGSSLYAYLSAFTDVEDAGMSCVLFAPVGAFGAFGKASGSTSLEYALSERRSVFAFPCPELGSVASEAGGIVENVQMVKVEVLKNALKAVGGFLFGYF